MTRDLESRQLTFYCLPHFRAFFEKNIFFSFGYINVNDKM